jgi:hypothetical protein
LSSARAALAIVTNADKPTKIANLRMNKRITRPGPQRRLAGGRPLHSLVDGLWI